MKANIVLWVFIGSALGSLCRYGVQGLVPTESGGLIPMGTLSVNLLGSLIIGWFAGLRFPPDHALNTLRWRQFVMTGFCGGFTTFSIFSLETMVLIESGAWAQAWINIALTTTLALIAVTTSYSLARKLSNR